MKLVLIGGGEIGTTNDKPYNLQKIDEEIVKLTNKPHPTLLFLGFNERSNYYFGILKKNFMSLGAMCTYLKWTEFDNEKSLESKFKRADIVYLNGGNTIEFMKTIRKYNLQKFFELAKDKGSVLCGISAGAICLCKNGSSDCKKYKSNENKFTLVSGTGLINIGFAPHFSSSSRRLDMPRMTKKQKEVMICMDNCSALVINDENFYVIKSDKNAKCYKAYTYKKEFIIRELESNGKVVELYSKD